MSLPKMFVDPEQRGIIRYVDDPMAGMLAGMHSAEVVEACNSYDALRSERDALAERELKLLRDLEALVVARHVLVAEARAAEKKACANIARDYSFRTSTGHGNAIAAAIEGRTDE